MDVEPKLPKLRPLRDVMRTGCFGGPADAFEAKTPWMQLKPDRLLLILLSPFSLKQAVLKPVVSAARL